MRWLLGFGLHSGIHLRSSSATSLAALPSGYRAKGGRANVVWHGLGGLCLISSSETSILNYQLLYVHLDSCMVLGQGSSVGDLAWGAPKCRHGFPDQNLRNIMERTYVWIRHNFQIPFLARLHQILWIGGFSNFFVNGSLPRRIKDSFYFTAILGYTDINCLDFPGWQSNHATHCRTILKMPPYRTCNS